MAHAQKPPPGDSEMFIIVCILFGTVASLYVFLHNWVELLITAIQCGREC